MDSYSDARCSVPTIFFEYPLIVTFSKANNDSGSPNGDRSISDIKHRKVIDLY